MTIIPGAIAAFLIAAVYLMFLREMDIFEKEKKRFSIMCFILGALFTFLLIPLQMKFPIMEWLPSSGDFLTRFKFHFFAVAFFEEFVKILPFIIMLRLPKVMDESFDYIKYASVGALGFATVENVLYFSRSLHIIEGRAFYTAVLHMFTSSVIAYSIYYARVKKGKSIITSFALSYVLAVALHALYNALISESETHILGVAFVGV
ncbi:MAG: PrsW family glutamic-type intramembrane protease, partial [Bacteroidia bacterium]